jgi:hypothetical protein
MTLQVVLDERGKTYGEFIDQAVITQALKEPLRSHPNWEELRPDVREALEMICSKMARIVNGDPWHRDSWVDIAGYATLVERTIPSLAAPPAPCSFIDPDGAP